MDHYINRRHLEELSSAWRDLYVRADVFVSFAFPHGSISEDYALKRMMKFLKTYICSQRRTRDGYVIKAKANVDLFWCSDIGKHSGKRPHIHTLIKHTHGELPSDNAIDVCWRKWVGWNSDQAIDIKDDDGSDRLFRYCLDHHHHYGLEQVQAIHPLKIRDLSNGDISQLNPVRLDRLRDQQFKMLIKSL